MARKIKSQKFTQIFKFPSWIVIGLLLVLFIYVMYNQYKEGATSVTDTKNVIPSQLTIGSTGNNTSSNSIPTSTQIQARELVTKWEEKFILDKKANDTVAADIDQYNIDFYKSMS